ncbi:glycosyltransferase family 48 protein [Paxillus involutus ATCC 200175]|nr:glycosyltransferase family 48 protein [Paxillus involutus ATCC 200175]
MPKQIYANLLVIAEVEPKYLIQLHPVEDNFIKDARIHAEETDHMDATSSMNEKLASTKTDALPLYCVDFKASSPEHLPHTYLGLTSLLDRVESPDIMEKLEQDLERMSRRKFKLTISMQRCSGFNQDSEQLENAEFLLRAYPDPQIGCFDEGARPKGSGPPSFLF